MSFQKRTRLPDIPGVRPSLHNGQPLTSTGNPSLDHILGGGIQVGTVLMVEEDKYAAYSNVLVRYFLAEGAVQKHGLFLATLDEDPKAMIEKLPAPVTDTGSSRDRGNAPVSINADPNEDMKIAWRYNCLPKVNSVEETSSTNQGHFFDLTTTIDPKLIETITVNLWNGSQDNPEKCNNIRLKNRKLQSCLNQVYTSAQTYQPEQSRNLLRVALCSIGSPYWYEEGFLTDFYKFLTLLKAIVRHTSTVCLITVPSHLLNHIDTNVILKTRSLVDTTIELQSFAGSDKETNPVFKDYHGLLFIRQTKAVNCAAPYNHKITDLAFKLRRRKFVIEKLHLPPELQDSDQREQDEIVPGMSCSTKSKHLLEF